ncbi:MAG: iron-containing redox enzyme family protein [Gammaproteobacteria bacterium]|nr:MAG: iron-containing redox enzyme family protein [Gammaproteobacteria bacterium]
MRFYQELLAQTQYEREAFLAIPLLRQGIAGEITLPQYLAFLGEAYHHVKHTLPLLMACGARLPERLEWLRVAVSHYIEEETGHQEWILNDIRNAGGDAEAVRNGRPSLATELMVSYAWDTVQRRNPVGFFGMVLVLEGTSVRLATQAAEAIQRRLGLGQECFSYLTSHGSLDVGHLEFFAGLMDRLKQPEDQEAVIHCARVMYRLYGDIFRTLQEKEELVA